MSTGKLNKKYKYDYLLVGAGLFNAIIANEATREGKKCLVIDKRSHIGGNLYCESVEGINVHKYGAHIFHTNDKKIWDYMGKLCEFNHFVNSPVARYKDELYNLPFNMNTFHQLWKVITPKDAVARLNEQIEKTDYPRNLEEQVLSLVGKDIYEKLVKGYTEKQWGKDARQLPPFIIERIPIRLTYNNNYFNDEYQGIPKGGYNSIFNQCFDKCDVFLNTDFLNNRHIKNNAERIIFSGLIDQYYDYRYGELEYRSLYFENEILNVDNYQGNAVINYTEREIPYTRILEHKHFEFGRQDKTVITREFPVKWEKGLEPYYPVNTEYNEKIFKKYKMLAESEKNIYFGGRLASYQYLDMDKTIQSALCLYKKIGNKL